MDYDARYAAEVRIKNLAFHNVDPRPALKDVSDYVLQVVNTDKQAYGYVIPLEALNIPGTGCVFSIMVKEPGYKRVFVSQSVYPDELSCLDDCEAYLKKFPLFMYSENRLVSEG